MLDFPIFYPTKLAPDSSLTDDSRAFPIDGPGQRRISRLQVRGGAAN